MVEALITIVGLTAAPLVVILFHFAHLPPQPVHPATARVVWIAAGLGRFGASYDTIQVRNAQGTGEFIMPGADVACRIGDTVPVEQQGVTLRRTAKTCR